jgi:hypothetical protein
MISQCSTECYTLVIGQRERSSANFFTSARGAAKPAAEGDENVHIRKDQKPAILPVSATAPLTALQVAFTATLGAPISVVPVSMAAEFPWPMLTLLPFTVTPDEQHV